MSWFSRLFGLSRKEPTCFDIVGDYGAVIENAPRSISSLMDVNQLPYEKVRIKAAILEAAFHLQDDPNQLKMLGAGFYLLGSFQEISTSQADLPGHEQLGSMDEEAFLRQAKMITSSLAADKAANEKAQAEKAELMAEWQKFLQALGNSNA